MTLEPTWLGCLLTLSTFVSTARSSGLSVRVLASEGATDPILLAQRGRLAPVGDGPAVTPKTVPAIELGGPENIAFRILKLDALVKPVTDQMFQTLAGVMDDACDAIGKLKQKQHGRWDWRHAEAVLRCIDAALISRGFLYPDVGAVDQLADGLTPFQMSAARRHAFETQPHNERHAA